MQIVKRILVSIILLFIAQFGYSQIEVDQTLLIEEYVNLLVGTGVEVSNITYTGSVEQIGFMTGGEGTTFPMAEGIVLSTEVVANITSPFDNTNNELISTGDNVIGEPDLFTVANSVPALIGQTFTVGTPEDVCILEFDFVATGDLLSFNYTFGSDEYLTWVNTQYNDIFSFFLSGPGLAGPYASPAGFPDGAVNIAQVPDSDPLLPITISSVNLNLNSDYYINNPVPNVDIDLNGFTTLLEASSPVVCGETYHIKLAIADCGDGSLESVVFLEANSFQAHFTEIVANPTIDGSLYYNNDTILVEGCNIGMFEFIRGDTLGIDTIFFDVFGDIDEDDLVDPLPDFVVFNEGTDTISLFVQAAYDNIDEDLEEFTLSYTYIQFCTNDTITTSSTIWLQDQVPPLLLASNEEIYCADIVLEPIVTQGDGPFFWNWGVVGDATVINNQSSQLIPFTEDIETTTYWVTIEDPCEYRDSINITVTPLPIPPLELSGDAVEVACPGDNTEVGFNIDSGANPVTWLWSTNSVEETINISPNGSTQVTVYAADGCGQTDTLNIAINVADPDGPLNLVMGNSSTPCPGYSTNIDVNAFGGYNTDGYTYLWSTGSTENIITVAPTEFGSNEYSVVVTDNCGFSTNGTGIVIVTAPPALTLSTSEELCIGITTVLTQEGGVDPVTLSTSIEVIVDANNIVSGAIPGIGTITAQDVCGQLVSTDILIVGCETTIPNIFTPGSGNSVGFNDTFVIDGIENFPNSRLKIFNRWGNLVYESNNYLNTWKAEDVAGGTYYYIFERVDEKNFSGYVEVLK